MISPHRHEEVALVAVRGDPSPLRWLIGVELARYRNTAGLSLAQASATLGMSKAKLGHLETGRQQQDPDDIARLLATYRAEQRDIDRLTSLTGRADEATWWAPWAQVVPDWLKTFVGLEGLASHEVIYAPLVLPALVQTEAYSVGATEGSARVRPDQVERAVSLRTERQRRLLNDTEPLRLTAIIEESVLDRLIGNVETMREQLQRLVELAERDNVEILVLPTAVGRHDSLKGRFTVLQFAQAQPIGYIEYPDGAIYVQDQDQVAGYTRTAESLRSAALSQNESVDALNARLASLI
jgi:transcriptional regulator with XRE-family HTH domain